MNKIPTFINKAVFTPHKYKHLMAIFLG